MFIHVYRTSIYQKKLWKLNQMVQLIHNIKLILTALDTLVKITEPVYLYWKVQMIFHLSGGERWGAVTNIHQKRATWCQISAPA